jgi:hypothetical protein
MLEKFLSWYKNKQASRMCILKWPSVQAELTESFWRAQEGKPIAGLFADNMAAKFFELYRAGKIS